MEKAHDSAEAIRSKYRTSLETGSANGYTVMLPALGNIKVELKTTTTLLEGK